MAIHREAQETSLPVKQKVLHKFYSYCC